MYCPKCKYEYREGFLVCSDCHVPLVDHLTKEVLVEKTVKDTVKIASASNEVDAGLIMNLLLNNNIPCFKKSLGSGGYMNIFMGYSIFGEEIYVSDSDANKAKALLNELTAEIEITNETDITNGIEITNGTEITNETNITNETDIINGTEITNETNITNETDLINGTEITNETNITNEADITNGMDITNGTDITNETDVKNNLSKEKSITMKHAISGQNNITIENEFFDVDIKGDDNSSYKIPFYRQPRLIARIIIIIYIVTFILSVIVNHSFF
ncbi:MAG: hypothetical protein K0S41_1434 [Anaerocolumna sp.]|jgi:hypothetical protein|nr:hypothetical protein [Anaerocolumna sp.]